MATNKTRLRRARAKSSANKRKSAKGVPKPNVAVSASVAAAAARAADRRAPISAPPSFNLFGFNLAAIAAPRTLAGLLLCVLIAVSYLPVIYAGLVWDDIILERAAPIKSLSGLWDIWFVPSSLEQYEGHYWPLLYTTFWLDHKLWGGSVLGYHLVNVALHAAMTLLLWRLLLRFGVLGAWFAAAIFAVHPLHVESVAWVIGRKDVLAGLFYLATVLCYVRFVEVGGRWRYGLAVVFFVASMLSKSVAVTLPVALLLWHWWQRGKVAMMDVARTLPLLLLGVGIAIADWLLYKSREVIAFDYSLVERLLIAVRALWFYVGKLLLPVELSVIYRRWEVGVEDWLAWGGLLVGVGGVALLWRYRNKIGRGALAGVLFFVVTLSPTVGLVDYGYMQFSFVADRYQYLAGAGVLVTAAVALVMAAHRVPRANHIGMRNVSALFGAALLAVLATLTWQQANIYRDNGTFFTHILSINPQARSAQHNLGDHLHSQGRSEEALAAYRRAAALRPNFPDFHNKIGAALQILGQFEKAKASYRRALSLKPRFAHAKGNLAMLLIKEQQYDEAMELFREVIATDPRYTRAYIGMGVALSDLGRYPEALRNFERALTLEPDSTDAQQGRDAILQFLQNKAQ